MLTKTAPKSYREIFFSLVESVNYETGEKKYKLPKESVEILTQLCRLELGKALDGSDISEPQPPKLSLAERIEQAKEDVNYYQDQLKDTNRWKLNDLAFFEYRLEVTAKELAKLKKRQHWQNKARYQDSVDVQALKENFDLVEIASSYGLSPRKSGKEYVCRCPFHEDKNPSFSVNSTLFHCFGCGESGDLIDFVMKIENCDFKQALEVLR